MEIEKENQTQSGSGLESSPCYQDLERWIREASPLLEKATCIVIDENIDRLSEIAGVRAVLESCPIDFTNPNPWSGVDPDEFVRQVRDGSYSPDNAESIHPESKP